MIVLKKLILKGIKENATRLEIKEGSEAYESLTTINKANLVKLIAVNKILTPPLPKKYFGSYDLYQDDVLERDAVFKYCNEWIKNLLNSDYIHSEHTKEKLKPYSTSRMGNSNKKFKILNHNGAKTINKLTPETAVNTLFKIITNRQETLNLLYYSFDKHNF